MTTGKKWLLVAGSVIMLSVGWLRISGLPLLAALVPLLLISNSYDSSRRSFWRMAGWTALTFCLWSVATIWWVWNAAPIGVFAATAVQVVLFGAVFMFCHAKWQPIHLAGFGGRGRRALFGERIHSSQRQCRRRGCRLAHH